MVYEPYTPYIPYVPPAGTLFDFRYVIYQWYQVGMFDVVLPLILVFAVVYAILQRSGLLGRIRAIDATVAFVVAFFVIGTPAVSGLFLPIFSQTGLAIIIALAVLLVVGLFLARSETPRYFGLIGAVFGIVMLAWLLSRGLKYYGIYISPDFWMHNAWWIIPLAIVILTVVMINITKGGTEAQKYWIQPMYAGRPPEETYWPPPQLVQPTK